MVHEAMVLEYSGRHLALIELSASLKLLLYISLIACLFAPWGISTRPPSRASCFSASSAMSLSSLQAACYLRSLKPQSPKCACSVYRNSSGSLDAGPFGDAATLRVEELLMHGLAFDIAHCWQARSCL